MLVAAFMGVLISSGCTSTAPRANRADAILNDRTVQKPVDTGYQVTAVDGKQVQRARSSIHTMVPVAIIEPGTRTLTLGPKSGEDKSPTTTTAFFEAGKRYRLASKNGAITVVEEGSDSIVYEITTPTPPAQRE